MEERRKEKKQLIPGEVPLNEKGLNLNDLNKEKKKTNEDLIFKGKAEEHILFILSFFNF